MSKTHTQYIYSTETLKEATIGVTSGKTRPPRAKIGQTKLSAMIRVDQQDGTFSFEPPEILDSILVPSHITDKQIHKKICSYESSAGVKYSMSRMDKDREWIDFHGEVDAAGMVDIWHEAINDLLYGVRVLKDFPAYLYQQEIVDKAVVRFGAGARDLLIAAIMRSGKCLITYLIAKAMGFKRILAITGKPGVDESWGALLPGGDESHIDFSKWKYHSYKSLKKSGFNPSKDIEAEVLFVSLQYLTTHLKSGKTAPKLVNDILKTKWDLIVFDEQHWATQTDATKNLLSKLKTGHKIELSGTAYKTLIQGRYEPLDVIAFDYVDEQFRRFNGTSAEQQALEFRPDINYALINVSTKIKKTVEELGDGFSFAKLLAVTDKETTFKNTQAVVDFLNFVHQKVYKNQYNGDLGKFKPYVQHINKHTMWVIPDSIKSASALVKLLEGHAYFGKYKIINATGNNIKNISEVQNIINDVDGGKYDGKQGTITITCGRFLEGTTVRQWWCVHQMNDDKSAADYFQGSFRTKSEDKKNDKRHVIVYDYNPERFIKVVYDANIDNARKSSGTTTGDIIRQWREVSGVYDYDGNEWNVVTGNDIISRANKDIELKMSMFNGVGINAGKVTPTLQSMMFGHKAGGNWTAITTLNKNGVIQTSNQSTTGAKKGNKQPKDPVKDTVEKFKMALSKLPNLIWSTYGRNRIGSYDDLCNYPDVGFIAEQTLLTPNDWRLWKDAIPDVSQIDRRIDSLNEWFNEND
jgi:hypothetical protein